MTIDTTAVASTLAADLHPALAFTVAGSVAVGLLCAIAVVFGFTIRRLAADRTILQRSREQLQRSEDRFRALAETSPIGIFMSDARGYVTYANPAATRIAAVERDSPMLTAHTLSVVLQEDRAKVAADVVAAIEAQSPYHGWFRLVNAHGELRSVQCDAVPFFDADALLGWVGSVVDVTGDIQQRRQLERLSEIIEKTPLYICICDVDGWFQYLNEAARRFHSIEPGGDVTHLRAIYAYAPASREKFLEEAIPTAVSEGAWSGELMLLVPGTDDAFPVSQVIVAHRQDGGNVDYFFSITSDLTQQKAFEAQLVHKELHDALTGLPNRLLLSDRLAQALARAERRDSGVALLFVDIDQFKLVNDSYGHEVGDTLLKRVGARLSESLHSGDTIARFPGDEFCIVAEEIESTEHALEYAHRLASTVSPPYDLTQPVPGADNARVFLTVSIGVAFAPPGASTPEDLLRDADAAMYRAKEAGRARVEVFAEDMRHSAVHRLRTAGDLHRALGRGEFRVVYQPEVDLATGHIVGVEALLRWHHPERGLVPPGEFIPLAEQTGLIERIGKWVLEEAVSQAARWAATRWDGAALPVWVNISARQLSSTALVPTVRRLLKEHDVEPAQIGLEVTETALPADADDAIAALGALRQLGIRLAVDDFGTGYSSLAYLKRLPVDALKVDRAFVDGLGHDTDDSAIVSAIVGMAKALRLAVIAEGVETATQLRSLRQLGCEVAQGYHFSLPEAPEVIERLLAGDRVHPLWPHLKVAANPSA